MILGHPWIELLQTLCLSIFFYGLGLLWVRLTGSVILSLLALVLYTLICATALRDGHILNFYSIALLTGPRDALRFLPYATMGLTLSVLSGLLPGRTTY